MVRKERGEKRKHDGEEVIPSKRRAVLSYSYPFECGRDDFERDFDYDESAWKSHFRACSVLNPNKWQDRVEDEETVAIFLGVNDIDGDLETRSTMFAQYVCEKFDDEEQRNAFVDKASKMLGENRTAGKVKFLDWSSVNEAIKVIVEGEEVEGSEVNEENDGEELGE